MPNALITGLVGNICSNGGSISSGGTKRDHMFVCRSYMLEIFFFFLFFFLLMLSELKSIAFPDA